MDAISSLIGGAKDVYTAGLQKQAAANTAAMRVDQVQGVQRRGPQLSKGEVNQQKVRAAAEQFEGFFISQMMEQMMAGIEPDATFGGGLGEETWRSMLNQEYGKQIAKTGKLGIADNVMKAMLHAQEERTAAHAAQQAAAQQNVAAIAATEETDVTGGQAAAIAAVIPTRR
jgi:flagellar protein FlgJ